MFLWYPVIDLARAPRRATLTARKKGSGYENGSSITQPRSQGLKGTYPGNEVALYFDFRLYFPPFLFGPVKARLRIEVTSALYLIASEIFGKFDFEAQETCQNARKMSSTIQVYAA